MMVNLKPINMNTQTQPQTVKEIRMAFVTWYEKAKQSKLPLYIPAMEKKSLKLQFEKATGIKYTL